MGNLPLKSCNPFNMAGLFQAFLGGSKPSASPIPAGDNDFADFAGAPEPTPAAYSAASSPVSFMGASAAPTGAAVPYTKWYNIHERHSLSDFKQEGVILAMIAVIVTVHMLGTSANRRKAKAWITAHATVLQKEFALVGFGGRKAPTVDEVESEGLAKATTLELPEELLKEKAPNEFSTYATGRQNVAFVDINLTLYKRYSPLTMIFEFIFSLFFESLDTQERRWRLSSTPSMDVRLLLFLARFPEHTSCARIPRAAMMVSLGYCEQGDYEGTSRVKI